MSIRMAGVMRYTVHEVGNRFEVHDAQSQQPSRVTFDSEAAAKVCAHLANAIEDATVAHLERWLAA